MSGRVESVKDVGIEVGVDNDVDAEGGEGGYTARRVGVGSEVDVGVVS
jgi:hypothetical protein